MALSALKQHQGRLSVQAEECYLESHCSKNIRIVYNKRLEQLSRVEVPIQFRIASDVLPSGKRSCRVPASCRMASGGNYHMLVAESQRLPETTTFWSSL